MKKLLLLLFILIAPLTKVISAPVFINHHSEQTDYIQVTPKGDTMYVYNKEIVSKEVYDKRVKEEKMMIAKIITWFILVCIGALLGLFLIWLSTEFDLMIFHLTAGSFGIFYIFYLIIWPIICACTGYEWGIDF